MELMADPKARVKMDNSVNIAVETLSATNIEEAKVIMLAMRTL